MRLMVKHGENKTNKLSNFITTTIIKEIQQGSTMKDYKKILKIVLTYQKLGKTKRNE